MRELIALLFASFVLAGDARSSVQEQAWNEDIEGEADFDDEAASRNFHAVMESNVLNAPQAVPSKQEHKLGFVAPAEIQGVRPAQQRTATLPLSRFEALRGSLLSQRDQQVRAMAPPVVLGAAHYEGQARSGALTLRMRLQVTLGLNAHWKMVPLVGEEVVVVAARRTGRDVPLSRQNGYHVWVTNESGEVNLELELLVPSRTPRGSIEYDFLIPRTPVTTMNIRFPVAGLEPRLTPAVRSEVRSSGNTTELRATLRPTARVRLVAYRDLGGAEERAPKIYAESLHLVSLDEDAWEMFTVVRYSILYAGTKSFRFNIPSGMSLVSADGEGAFRYTLQPQADGSVVMVGETAYPIRNGYEISLRLRREITAPSEGFPILRPTPLGVEREYGWLGVEVTGALNLQEKDARGMTRVDVRQLPADMLTSAVSPILKAYRYHDPTAALTLVAEPLPEQDPSSHSVDSVRAYTTVSIDGKMLTEMRITLRNRLRHQLILTLPPGAELRSSALNDQPIKPSRDASDQKAGRVMLPLKRSGGGERLEPFTLSVVVEHGVDGWGWLGARTFTLPGLDLPASSVVWSLYLPARNDYTRLFGDVGPQPLAGTGQWHQPSLHLGGLANFDSGGAMSNAGPAAADGGAMPVRIEIPKSGKRLDYRRYWLEAEQPAEVQVGYARTFLRLPLLLLLTLVLAFGAWCVLGRWVALPGARSWQLGTGLLVAGFGGAWLVGSSGPVMVALGLVLLGGALIAMGPLLQGLRTWAQALPQRLDAWRKDAQRPKVGAALALWRLALSGGILALGLAAMVMLLQLLALLGNPVG